MRRLVICLLLLLTPGLLLAGRLEQQYDQAAGDYHRLLRPGKFRDNATNWVKTIKRFEGFADLNGDHAKAPDALYSAGKLCQSYYRWNKKTRWLERAIYDYSRMVEKYPKADLAPDAQLQIALIYEQVKDPAQAKEAYRRLGELYPNSSQAAQAKAKIPKMAPTAPAPEPTPAPVASAPEPTAPKLKEGRLRAYDQAAQDFHKLYRPGRFRDLASNWIKTIEAFEKIAEEQADHIQAPQALYSAAKLADSLYNWNHQQQWLNRAVANYRKLVANYPDAPLAPDAQFQAGAIYEEELANPNQAYLEYQKVIDQFPKSIAAKQAKNHLDQLKPPPKQALVSPDMEEAVKPMDLTEARYGGLDEAQSNQIKNKRLLKKIDYWSNSDWSRMVINTEDKVRFKYQVLAADKESGKGRRMYLDIYQSFLPKEFKDHIAANDGLINQARIAQFDKTTVRVVLDLASLHAIKVYPFELPHQYKIIIDIAGNQPAPPETPAVASPPASSNPAPAKTPKAPLPAKPVDNAQAYGVAPKASDMGAQNVTLSQALGLKVKRIIIDPGHGGHDPGASANGLTEKLLALSLAKELKAIINQEYPGIEVLMTREKDNYLSLESRTAYANKNRGDLFISIHLNASKRQNVSGMETYFLNLTTDSYALALAAKENQTSLKSISNLQGLLNDLLTHSKIQESNELAKLVQNQGVQSARQTNLILLRDLGVKQAPFFVLLGAQMPSILVEAGFITNKKESDLLKTPKYRSALIQGIYRGINRYMDQL